MTEFNVGILRLNKTGFRPLKEAHRSDKDGWLTAVLHPVQSTFTLTQHTNAPACKLAVVKWRLGSLCIQDAKQLQVTKRPLAAMTGSCRNVCGLLTDIFYKPFASVWGRNDTFSFSTMWKTDGKGKEKKRQKSTKRAKSHMAKHQQWHLVVELVETPQG